MVKVIPRKVDLRTSQSKFIVTYNSYWDQLTICDGDTCEVLKEIPLFVFDGGITMILGR